jgi:predicted HTH transcriptional regulator
MEKLSKRQNAVLEIIDEQIEELEGKLQKVQPLINELNRLKQTRKVLLSERGTTGGGGNSARTQLSMEEVIHFLRENGASSAQEIAEAHGVAGHIVRSHLSRHKDTRYENVGEGQWQLIGEEEEEE